MRPRSLLILTAVTLEANAIAAALEMARPAPRTPAHGSRDGLAITLALTGVCAKHLPTDRFDDVIMAGLAGALDPALHVGDVLVGEWPGDLKLPAGALRGTIHTQSAIATTPAEKATLFAQTQASAVDMEGAVVRDWARDMGASFGAIRAISDRADQTLDPAVLRFIDPWGRIRPWALTRTLLLRPALVPHLIRLGSDSKAAARKLGEAVRDAVEATWT